MKLYVWTSCENIEPMNLVGSVALVVATDIAHARNLITKFREDNLETLCAHPRNGMTTDNDPHEIYDLADGSEHEPSVNVVAGTWK